MRGPHLQAPHRESPAFSLDQGGAGWLAHCIRLIALCQSRRNAEHVNKDEPFWGTRLLLLTEAWL